MSCSTRLVAVSAVVGIVVFTVGLFMYNVAPDFFQKKLKQALPIQESSPLWQSWVEPDVPIYVQFYFYDVQNPYDIKDGNLPARLKQVGPYTFRKLIKKSNITFESTNGTVSYILRKWFVFEPSLTNGSLGDVITTANVPLMAFCQKSEGQVSKATEGFLNNMIRVRKSTLFVKRTIGELMFDGYFEEFIDFIAKQQKTEILPDGKFGFFYKMNGTGQTFVANTGLKDLSRVGAIEAWSREELDFLHIRNGSYNSLTFWNATYCDAIDGTDGSRFTPSLSRDSILRIFVDELCRSIYISFKEDTTVKGIPTFRFTMPKEVMTQSEENKCFCSGQHSDCLGDGLLNVSTCKKGAPIILSPPLFTQLGPEYMELYPDLETTEVLETFADIEPITGLILNASKKLQVNVYLRHYGHVWETRNLKRPLVFPLFWVNEFMEIPSDKAEKLRKMIIVLPRILNYSSLAVLGLGIIIILFAIECAIVRSCRKTDHDHLKPKPYTALPSSHFVRLPPTKVTSCSSTQAMLDSEDPQVTSGPL